MKFTLLFLIFIFAFEAFSKSDPIDITKYISGTLIGDKGEYHLGPERIDQLLDLKFKSKFQFSSTKKVALKSIDQNIRTSDTPIWVRFKFLNPSSMTKTVYLDADQYPYKEVILYRGNQFIDKLLINDNKRERFFKLDLKPSQQTTYYLKIKVGLEIFFKPTCYLSIEDYLRVKHSKEMLYSTVTTIISMSLLLNLMIFIIFKSFAYFYYLMYLTSLVLFNLSIWKLHDQIFYPFNGIAITSGFLAIFSVLFTIRFLSIKRHHTLYIISCILGGVFILATIISFVNPNLGFDLVQYLSMVGGPFSIFLGIFILFRHKEIYALIYTLGYGMFIVGITLNILYNLHILENVIFSNASLYGAITENILMLIAIAQKITTSENQRRHSFKQLEKVFYPHQLDMMKKGEILENTMPIGEGTACVLAFDVISSSKYDYDSFGNVWEEFMYYTRKMLTDSYDGDKLISTAYMIKEVGDGFLCSIGYPFSSPERKPLGYTATDLAHRIVKRFNSLMKEKELDILCSIGIAKGPVRGYFSKSGAIRHDLFGEAIVLATRYEYMRNLIFKEEMIPQSQIVTLEASVYEDLPASEKKHYKILELNKKDYSVRDHPDAAYLAFRIDFDSDTGQFFKEAM